MESLTPTDEERAEFADVLTTGHAVEGVTDEPQEDVDADEWAPDETPYDDFEGDQDEVDA